MQELTVSWGFSRLGSGHVDPRTLNYIICDIDWSLNCHTPDICRAHPAPSVSRQFRHVKVVPKWELHMPLATSWVLLLTSLTATPPVSLCLLCCGGTQRPLELMFGQLCYWGAPCLDDLSFKMLRELEFGIILLCVSMCDLSCSTNVLAHAQELGEFHTG